MLPLIPLVALLAGAPQSQDGKEPLLEIDRCEMGDVYAHNKGACVLTLRNNSDHAIEVHDFTQPKPAISFDPSRLTIAPHSAAYMKLTVDVGNAAGNTRFPFQFHTNEEGHFERVGGAYAYAISALDDPRPEIDLGSFDYDSKRLPKGSVSLQSHDAASFHITSVLEVPKYLEAKVTNGNTLSVQMLPGVPWGVYEQFVRVGIDSPDQKEAWIAVKASVLGEVRSEGSVALGAMRKGEKNERLIRVSSRKGEDFKIDPLELKGVEGTVSAVPCEPVARGCQLLRLVVSDKQDLGMITGQISVGLPEFKQSLPIPLWGLFLAKNAKIEKISDLEQKSQNNQSSAPASSDVAKEIEAAIAKGTNEPDRDVPPGNGPLLRWQVSNSMPVYGFQIFRSTTAEGPFVLLNKKPIRSNATDAGLVPYKWRDNTAEAGQIYWYYIGLLNKDGTKQRLSSIQKVQAK